MTKKAPLLPDISPLHENGTGSGPFRQCRAAEECCGQAFRQRHHGPFRETLLMPYRDYAAQLSVEKGVSHKNAWQKSASSSSHHRRRLMSALPMKRIYTIDSGRVQVNSSLRPQLGGQKNARFFFPKRKAGSAESAARESGAPPSQKHTAGTKKPCS